MQCLSNSFRMYLWHCLVHRDGLAVYGFSMYTLKEGRQTTFLSLNDKNAHYDYYDWDTIAGTTLVAGFQSVFYINAPQRAVEWLDFTRLSFADVFGSGAVYSLVVLFFTGIFLLIVSVKNKKPSANVVSQ